MDYRCQIMPAANKMCIRDSSTSGTHCPYLGGAYAMALIAANSVKNGDIVEVDVRGRRIEAEIVPLPFYKRA